MKRNGLRASKGVSFENVDGRTDGGCIYILQAHLCAFDSGELIKPSFVKTLDQLPRLGNRELICLLLFTCNYVVSV